MNFEQLKAILWLRWRLSQNQWRKGGTFNFVLMSILVFSLLIMAGLSFFLAIGLGVFLLPRANPTAVMIVWDVIIGVLLFSWSISLLVEIQRMEMLSLEKLLHLPMSLKDAFLLNYLSSLICLNIICFFPAAMGLSVAMAISFGAQMLVLIPLVLSFILMLTAVTYQFRGWVGALMSDKRRQRTVIMMFTFGFIAITQIPNIVIQLSIPKANQAELQRNQEQSTKSKELLDLLSRKELTQEEYNQKIAQLSEEFKQRKIEAEIASQAILEEYLTIANQILPVGWLPYGSKALLTGSIWQAGLCLVGMSLIGATCLRRAYTSTIRYYTGNVKSIAPKTSSKVATLKAIQAGSIVKPSFME